MSCDISLKLSPKKGSKTTTMIKFTVKTHQQARSESEENETQYVIITINVKVKHLKVSEFSLHQKCF